MPADDRVVIAEQAGDIVLPDDQHGLGCDEPLVQSIPYKAGCCQDGTVAAGMGLQ